MTGKMRSLLVLVWVALAPPAALAQSHWWTVRARVGVDENNVGTLREWQLAEQYAVAGRGISLHETDAFPAFLSIQADLGLVVLAGGTPSEVGIEVGLGSTGGRLYYEDYSGTFVVDRLARRIIVGAYVEHTLALLGPVRTAVGVRGRANISTVTYQRRVTVGGEEVEAYEATFSRTPGSIEPSLVLETGVSSRLRVRAHVGREFSMLVALDEPDGTLPDEASVLVGLGWSGFQASVGVGARFGG